MVSRERLMLIAVAISAGGCWTSHERADDAASGCVAADQPLAGIIDGRPWQFSIGQSWPASGAALATLWGADSVDRGRCWPVTPVDRIELTLPSAEGEWTVGPELEVEFVRQGGLVLGFPATDGWLRVRALGPDGFEAELCARDELGDSEVSGTFRMDQCSP